MIHFNFDKKRKTTGWQNNCGLNCLTHFFADKLGSNELQALQNDPEYLSLLETFQTYYNLSDKPTLDDLFEFFKRYPNPIDREVLFAPVLRKHLEKIILKDEKLIWDSIAAGAISEYLTKKGKALDVASPMYEGNPEFFKQLKRQYSKAIKESKTQPFTEIELDWAKSSFSDAVPAILNPTPEQLNDKITFFRKNKILDDILAQAHDDWKNEVLPEYAQRMSNLDTGEMVDSHQLSWLCQALQIGLEIYTPQSIESFKAGQAPDNYGCQDKPNYNYKWLLRVYNADVHWEFEHPNNSKDDLTLVKEHNAHYPTPFYMSGQFKSHHGIDLNKVNAAVNTFFKDRQSAKASLTFKPSPPVLNKFKQTDSSATIPIGTHEGMSFKDVLDTIKKNTTQDSQNNAVYPFGIKLPKQTDDRTLQLNMVNNSIVYVKETANDQGQTNLEYSLQSEEKDLQQTIENICELAVQSAKPGTLFTLSNDPNIAEKTEKALKKAIREHRQNYPDVEFNFKMQTANKEDINIKPIGFRV